MELTEAKIFEAFGYPEQAAASAAASDGAREQEPAEPAAETRNQEPDTGAKEQEPAVPAEGTKTTAPQKNQEQEPQEPQTEEQRRQNAARRRQQERQAAVEQAVAQARQEMQKEQDAQWEQFFRDANFKNSVTGEPIRTREEYLKWQEDFANIQLQEQLKAGELTQEALQQVISQNPVVQQAQQLIQREETARAQQEQAEEQQRIQQEIASIGEMDPRIKTVADLANMPQEEFTRFKSFVDKGYSFLDSYKLSHMDKIINERAEAARIAAMNNARGKDHLVATGNPMGTMEQSVPKAQLEIYRKLNPNASMDQIQKHWNKYHK